MIKILFILIMTINWCYAKSVVFVDIWGQLAEYGDMDNPPRKDQLMGAEEAPGLLLFKNFNCFNCDYVYHSPLTKAYGDVQEFIVKKNLPQGTIIQHSNFGLDYLSILIDYFLHYKFNIISTDFDSLFYNFSSNSSWRNYFSLKDELIRNKKNKIIIFTTNHSLGSTFYSVLLKNNNISNYIIFVKDLKGEYIYQTPHVKNNIIYYTHEIELKNEFNINKIPFHAWKEFEYLLENNKGISTSLEPFLIKVQANKKNQQIKNRTKQVKKKIDELYDSLKYQYLINSKNQDAEE